MLPVQVDVRPLCFPASDVEVTPPVCICGERVAGVLVKTVVELVLNQSDHNTGDEEDRPVGLEYR